MNAPLYDLTGKYLELINDADLEPEAIVDTLEGIEGEIKIKAENIAKVDASWQASIDVIDHAIEKLKARRTMFDNKKKALRDYLKTNMSLLDMTKIVTDFFSITLAKGRDVVLIVNEKELPDDYVVVVTTTRPDKVKLLKDLKAGNEIPGATLIKSEPSIRIKQ